MRHSVIMLAILLSGFVSQAAHDRAILEKTTELKANLSSEQNPNLRLMTFENYRDFLFDHLQTVPLPETPEQQDEFAQLNEFQASIFMIRMDKVSPVGCRQNWEKVASNGLTPGQEENPASAQVAPSTNETLEILKLICR